jgi:2-polyprenyl-3-methyl-5-hydroxy-6-metoxy-1,4-benzoquinol methylase
VLSLHRRALPHKQRLLIVVAPGFLVINNHMDDHKASAEYKYDSNQLAHTYSYLTIPLLAMLPPAIKNNKNSDKTRILDLGCGNGSFSDLLNNLGYEMVGVEYSASGIAIAQQQYPNCNFIEASIYDLPYSQLKPKFDVVISVEVIEHLFDPKQLIRSAKQCLKPGGTLILTTPYHGYWKNLALALSGKMDSHHTVLWDVGHIKFFSVPTLTKLLEAEGCKDIQFQFAGRFPYLWKSMLCQCKVS